jgi:hypothetical protein
MSIDPSFKRKLFRNLAVVLLLAGVAAPGCAVDDRLRVATDADRYAAAGEPSKRDNLKRFVGTLEPNDVVMVFDADGDVQFFDETLAPAQPADTRIEPGKTEFLNPIDLRFVSGSCTVVIAMPGKPLRTYTLADGHPLCKSR